MSGVRGQTVPASSRRSGRSPPLVSRIPLPGFGDDVGVKGTRTVLLLGCVKLKQERRAAAKDLYWSPLWVRRRAFAEASGHEWLILSAKHGLIDPDKRLEPYDLALSDLDAADRRSWGERVARALRSRFGSFDGTTFEVHAGEACR